MSLPRDSSSGSPGIILSDSNNSVRIRPSQELFEICKNAPNGHPLGKALRINDLRPLPGTRLRNHWARRCLTVLGHTARMGRILSGKPGTVLLYEPRRLTTHDENGFCPARGINNLRSIFGRDNEFPANCAGNPCLAPVCGAFLASFPPKRLSTRGPEVGNRSFGASEESIGALFETHGTVSLRLAPAQAPGLQRVRSPQARMWEAMLQSQGLRQCRRERYFNVHGLLGRVLPGLEGQQAFFDGGEPPGGGGAGGFGGAAKRFHGSAVWGRGRDAGCPAPPARTRAGAH
jgi:hypothetical protein